MKDADWRAFGLVGLTVFVTQTAFYLTTAALPLYFNDLGAAEGRIGLEVGAANIVGIAANFWIGPWLDRQGARKFLLLGGLVYLVSSTGMLLFPEEFAVTVFRGMQGIGGAALIPAAYILSAHFIPGRQATALGLVGAVNGLALAMGPPIGLTLYSDFGARALFVPSIAAAVVGVTFAYLAPSVPTVPRTGAGHGFNPAWTRLLIGYGLGVLYFGGIVAYLPLILRQSHGPNAGIFFTADALGVLMLRIPTGIVVDRYGSFLSKIGGVAIALAGIAVLFITPSIWTMIVSGALTGTSGGLFITAVLGDLSAMSTQANRGTAMAIGGGSFAAALFVGSAVSGLLIDHGGFHSIVAFGFITCAASLPFVWFRLPREGGRSDAAA